MKSRLVALIATVGLLLVTPAAPAAEAPYLAYAPLIYLAQGETKPPTGVSAYLQHASLGWSHRGCPDHQLAKPGAVSAASLGNGSYKHQKTNSFCAHTGSAYASNQDVRPNDTWYKEGMYLDLDDAQHGMGGVDAGISYDYVRGDHLTYWLFYAYNDGPLVQNHEGDWERISIRLDAGDKPLTVAYFHHGGSCVMSYADAPKSGTHPIGYSASGTHATYPTVGEFPTAFGFKDHTSKGAAWATASRAVQDVRTMPWYGFGGAWGEVGEAEVTTGPRGPSAYKSPTPVSWTSPAC